MNDDNDILAGLDFTPAPILATDLVKPCPEGDDCVLADRGRLLATIVESVTAHREVVIVDNQIVTGLVTVLARHGEPELANQLWAIFEPVREAAGTFIATVIAWAEKLEA